MTDNRPARHQEALDLWSKGKILDAGRLLFQSLDPEDRPTWSCDILRNAIRKTGFQVPVAENVLKMGGDSTKWSQAKTAFSEVRQETLRLEGIQKRSPEERVMLRLLYVAELVAKVLYNCTDPLDPFDEDSGWWIASCFKDLIELFEGANSSSVAWSVLTQTA